MSVSGWNVWTAMALIGAMVGVGGCSSEPPQIVRYRAPKDPPPLIAKRQVASAAVNGRLVAAVIRHDTDVWFLRATAAPSTVEQYVDGLREIARSFEFRPDGTPQWKLPDGWQELPGDSIRYRTLRAAGGSGQVLDVAVTKLPFPGGDWDSYLLANVNRWRGQIGLEPLSAPALERETKPEQTAAGDPLYWFDFLSAPVTIPEDASTTTANSSSGDARAPVSRDFQPGVVPDSWQPLPPDAMRRAAYAVGQGDQKGEVTVIALGPQSGSLEDNVNRWRGQIGLPPASAEEIAASRRAVTIGDVTADFFRIEPASDQGEAIRGVIARRPDRVWFFKLRGPVSLVRQEEQAFERFVTSTKLP